MGIIRGRKASGDIHIQGGFSKMASDGLKAIYDVGYREM